VIKSNPECLQLSEQLAPEVGSEDVVQTQWCILAVGSWNPTASPLGGHHLTGGLLCQTYWEFCGVPELAEFLHLGPRGSVGRRMLCGSARPRGVIPFPLNSCVPLPCFPRPPSLVFYLSFSLALKTKVQRTNIPWLVSEMLHPASGHWSPLPVLLRATAGKHPPMETVRTPEIFSKPVC